MLTFGDWQSALTATQSGRIWWANFQYDVRLRNITALTESHFRQEVDRLLAAAAAAPDPPPAPMMVIDRVIKNAPALFNLKCTRVPTAPEPYSRVLDAVDFARFNVRRSEIGLEMDENTSLKVWQWLGTIIDNTHYTGTMETARAFFWCAPTRSLKRIQDASGAGQAATEVRNKLGLRHVGEGRHLLRVDLPEYILTGRIVRAPTTLDAGSGVVFAPCDDPMGIGWTLNLITLGKGVEELVVESLPFNGDYAVTRIGIVANQPPPINWPAVEAAALGR